MSAIKKLKALPIHNLLSSKAYAAMASALSYPSLPLRNSFLSSLSSVWIRYSSLTLPSTSLPATIAIYLDKSEKLLVRRRRIVGSKRSMDLMHLSRTILQEAIVCVEDKQMSEFFFHLIRNQRLPIFKEPCFLILAPLYLSFCSIEHDYISFSWTSWDHKEFKLRLHQFLKKSRISITVLLGPVFLGNKGLNDVENEELPRLVYVLVRREPN
ncbi:LOW QUALITY PROTEIN: hypothetical protein HID58_062704 [Brassica napus]|uniref:Uncharacterized protein n=1 Tax=Brassica napus TaxID=3708 RepID=A0ABQ8A2A3_BRANA|nr:LOW QUALITY PROTEIN: hypothetical protein HID58_062704 [Brassica napus]